MSHIHGGTIAPNPDFPQLVKSVAGANTIDIVGKNLFDNSITSNTWLDASGNVTTLNGCSIQKINVTPGATYTLSEEWETAHSTNNGAIIAFYDNNDNMLSRNPTAQNATSLIFSKTAPANSSYMMCGHYIAKPTKIQVEKNPIATTYEAYKSQSFDLNLGYQLFNKNNFQTIKAYFTSNNPTFQSNNNCLTAYMRCEPNTTYTITKVSSSRFGVGYCSNLPAIGGTARGVVGGVSTETRYTITTDAEANYLVIWYYFIDNDNPTTSEYIASTIQVVKGSETLPYCNYFTPIELCKIGNYQDYLYNKGGKWYKHTEVGKIILNGTENWDGGSAGSVSSDYRYFFCNNLDYLAKVNYYLGYCNKFSLFSENNFLLINSNVNTDCFSVCSPNIGAQLRLRIMIKGSRLTSTNTSGFKTWLSINQPQLYYVLETPIEEEITDLTALTYLNNIKYGAESYYGTTNITITSSELQPTMKVQTLDKIGG